MHSGSNTTLQKEWDCGRHPSRVKKTIRKRKGRKAFAGLWDKVAICLQPWLGRNEEFNPLFQLRHCNLGSILIYINYRSVIG